MPMLKRLVCPNCGANIDDDGSDGVFTCSYCSENFVAAAPEKPPEIAFEPEPEPEPEAPPPTEPPPQTSGRTSYNVGDKVAVNWKGTWYDATIISQASSRTYRVHYTGWASSWDEDVDVSTIRPAGTVTVTGSKGGCSWITIITIVVIVGFCITVGVCAGLCGGDGIEATGAQVTADTPLSPGDSVHAQWGSSWYEAEVRTVHTDGTVTVHYSGYRDSSDEAVDRSRLRLLPGATQPPAAPSGTPSGSPSGQNVERIPLAPLSGPPSVGMRVLAPWDVQRYFYALVESFDPQGNVTVQFLDGDRRTISAISLRQDTITPGTPVAAKPQGSDTFYISRVRQRNGDDFEVVYGDGSSGWVGADSIFVRAQ